MMEELDLLKKDWKRNANSFEQISEVEIYKMLHKKSSSIVKWILIISVLEISFGFIFGILMSFTKYDSESLLMIKKLGLYYFYVGTSIITYSVALFFIYRFYILYKRISVVDNTKKLISTILGTRKIVKQYIAFNLTAFALFFVLIFSFAMHNAYIDIAIKNGNLNPEIPLKVILLFILILIVSTGILTFAFWFVYKLLYGILLKRLMKNYSELKKIDL